MTEEQQQKMELLFSNNKFKEFIAVQELNEKDDSKEKAEQRPTVSLSDETVISGTTWGELRKSAMEPDYLTKSPFAKYLRKREKETL